MKNRSKADGASDEQASDDIQPKTSTVFFKRPQSPTYVKQYKEGGSEIVELWKHQVSLSIRTFGTHFGLDKGENPVFITEAQFNRAKRLCLAKLLTKTQLR